LNKTCTVQIYLPPDDAQRRLGTSFYRRSPDGKFELARTLEYMPNSAYCFTVGESSWHGTEFREFEKPRDSLMLTYFKEPYTNF
jgi:hypothetical protein